jgi:hypothetical protein
MIVTGGQSDKEKRERNKERKESEGQSDGCTGR